MANVRSDDKVQVHFYLSRQRVEKIERLCVALKIDKTALVTTLIDMAVETIVRSHLNRVTARK